MCNNKKRAMPNSHHVMYLNVGCVCVRVCVTEVGRDLFMHNKSIWLIIEDVWNLFVFKGSMFGALQESLFYSSLQVNRVLVSTHSLSAFVIQAWLSKWPKHSKRPECIRHYMICRVLSHILFWFWAISCHCVHEPVEADVGCVFMVIIRVVVTEGVLPHGVKVALHVRTAMWMLGLMFS